MTVATSRAPDSCARRQLRAHGADRVSRQVARLLAVVLLGAVAGCSGGTSDGPGDLPATASTPGDPAPGVTPGPVSAAPGTAPVEDPEITALRAAVEHHPQDQEAHHALAVALNEAEARQASIPHFEKAVALEPSVRNIFDLAVANAGASRFPQAAAAYRRLLTLLPEDPLALHNLGNVLLNMGEKDAAIETLWRAIRADPTRLTARYDLARIYKFYGQHQEAYSMFQSVRNTVPRDERDRQARADSLYQIASIDVARGAHAHAEETLASLLRMMPRHLSAHYARGQALLHLGRLDEAQREFDTHVQLLDRAPSTSPMASGR